MHSIKKTCKYNCSIISMTRPPVVHGAFSLGLSVAILKGVKKTVRKHLEKRGWIEPRKVDYEFIFTIDRLKNLVDEKDGTAAVWQHDTSELSWRKVLNFVSNQFSELDTRIYVLLLLLCVLLPIAWTVLDGDSEDLLNNNDNDDNVGLIGSKIRLKHYNDGERAVLQFGKSRSEPIILSYKDMDMPEEDREFTTKKEREDCQLVSKSENALDKVENVESPGGQAKQHLEVDTQCNRDESGEKINGEGDSSKEEDRCSSSEVGSHDESKEEVVTDPEFLSRDTRTTSSLKSSRSFPISFKGSINQPSSLLHLQVSPTKSTNLDAQVNTEQAYSQPFRY